ncbi:molybdopterin molybdotransferase MoeA [Psychromonas sp. Urea-02u-13]|uniref:molybdopterin molybdotransferase MoeA n=1 Tax=Psychromonas sp. Urea-02u-13 TaxID=2058326 RepID=UPI000C31E968|nr:molybdopterin molybdotransferase MoeA [Psychromonas sp. Urea-02u-13]PKG40294.1 molybdopterin molybdotransferase [Psychromonas sp. Urea-02u-13]
MGCCDAKGLMPLEQALTKLQTSVSNVCEAIILPLSEALGFALAQDIQSPINVPPFNNSAMDGYAMLQADLLAATAENPITLTLVGKSFAGDPYSGSLVSGQCLRIMTGAVMPSCADTVVMQENTLAQGDQISFSKTPTFADNVRLAGEDLVQGQEVLKQGHKLTPRDIPLIASLGIANISVYRKLKVAVISSGDELKNLGQPLAEGDIYDSNRYSIIALLSRLNVDVIDFGIIRDDLPAIREAIQSADQQADVVITSGGVSVGEADFIKEVLSELGEIGFWKLAIKPGKPFAFGKLPSSVFFGLPGNPVSAMVTLYQLAVPAMATMAGLNAKPAIRFNAITTDKLRKAAGRTDFQRAVYSVNQEGQLVVSTTGSQGSGVFSSMSQSNCFIVLEQDRGNVASGETVTIEPYSALMD